MPLRFLSGRCHLRRLAGRARCSILLGRARQIELHPRHVVPTALFPYHASVQAGVLEPEGSMETVAGLVGLGDAGEGLPVGALGEATQQLTKKFASCAGAVMGDVGIPVSVARWKAARRFKGCPCAKPMI
jgi:hypothetical protein